MLYDNAQLASAYLSAFQVTGREGFARVAQQTLAYLLTDLRDPEGGFHAAEDADSEGEEGRFYVWRPSEIAQVLGDDESEAFCDAYGVTATGTFEHGASVLHRAPGADPEGVLLSRVRDALLEARKRRVRPAKDDKVVASWNGLALSALAKGAQVLRQPELLASAQGCARFLCGTLLQEGRLARTWRRGVLGPPGFLEDYGALMGGLLDLFETDFDPAWLQVAETLGQQVLERFVDGRTGALCDTEADQPDLLVRSRARHDGVVPSGATLALRSLLRLAAHRSSEGLLEATRRAAGALAPDLSRSPWAYHGLLLTWELLEDGPQDLLLEGELSTEALAVLWGHPGSRRVLRRGPEVGLCRIHLCDQGVCHPSLADPAEVARRLGEG